MLVLHGSWLPGQGKYDARFALWGEAEPNTPPARWRQAGRTGKQPPWHPFAVDGQRLSELRTGIAPAAREEDAPLAKVVVRLPSSAEAPLPSPDLADGAAPPEDETTVLAAWRVNAIVCEPVHALRLLLALDADGLPPQAVVGDDLRYWVAAGRLALELLYRQRFMPTLQRARPGFAVRWRPLLEDVVAPLGGAYGEESDRSRLEALVRAMPPSCRALAWQDADQEPRPRELLLDFLASAVDAVARWARPFPWLKPPSQRNGGETWLGGLQDQPLLKEPWRLSDRFYDEYRAWAEPEATPGAPAAFRVCFRLCPPDESPPTAGPAVRTTNAWTLEYLLQATDDPSLLVPTGEVWRRREATARFVGRRLANPQEHVLAGLGRAARVFPPVEASLHQARPEGCALSTAEAYDFVREKALLLRTDGFGVLVPSLETRLGVRVKVKGKSKAQGLGLLGWDRVVEYDWQVLLGDEPLSRAEFEALARLKEPLVQVRGRWVELRPEQIEQALTFFARRAEDGEVTLPEAMRLALAPDGEHGLPVVEVSAEGWFAELLHSLGEGGGREELAEPPAFVGQLRHYQRVGLSWLASLCRYGLGACLADDMGLGKTIELIAVLLHARQDGAGGAPALLVCPTSVVGNWRRELERFAPSLRVLVHHGAGRAREDFASTALAHDVVLSTYALLHRDEEELKSVAWQAVVLDEAQNIKNPSTKAAQAARGLRAGWRAALTGTPVENRLGDLWSIFQFLNPGYLGSGEDFKRRFADPIERLHDGGAAARLKKLVAPFILRRLKTDRAVIADLPEKNEMKVFCNLTKEQATLYAAVVEDSLRQIEEAEGEGLRRRGVVLATLAKLKQVCDHPALFLKDGSALAGRSGKLARLGEMLEEVLAVDERALIFSQYAQMGKLLVAYLGERLGREVLFLHGGTPAPERDRMVARFQGEGRGPHLFVLSLKAGGTGLNLTAANHVFHFDRWWNPAVEDQATDRAFRIGQRRDVEVHKFVCAGTFEEAIDDLIERKKELAQAIVGAGEAWLTELSTAELRELFALRAEAVAED